MATNIRTDRKLQKFEDIYDAIERMGMTREEAFQASGFEYGPTGSLESDWIEFLHKKRGDRQQGREVVCE